MGNLVFEAKCQFKAPAADVFAWHEAPGAFARLSPPWVDVRLVEHSGGIQDGARVVLQINQGPVGIPWVLGHKDYVKDEQFCDYQIAGPFQYWQHVHRIVPLAADDAAREQGFQCLLHDRIEFSPPLGLAGKIGGALYVKGELKRLFRYRHALLARDLELKARYGQKKLRVLISGSTGMIGTHLKALLRTQGHEVYSLVRRRSSKPDEIFWDPTSEECEVLPGGLDAIVHLCGRNVAARRWNVEEKQLIFESRVRSTNFLARLVADMKEPPAAVIFASAVGYYGDRGSEPLTEDSSSGAGFLADVCKSWEESAAPAEKAGCRIAFARIGAVLSPKDGALGKLLPVFLAGGGGPVGDGKQYFPWVSIEDVSAGIYHAIVSKTLSGPFNLVSPQAATNGEFARTLARVLRRPCLMPVKPAMLKAVYGEMAEALILPSQRVLPQKLQQDGYEFLDAEMGKAIKLQLGY